MTCTFPPALTDNQLFALIEGEADGATSRHMAGCEACRQRAQQLARQQQRLSARLYRIACPPSLELGEFQLGMLSNTVARNITHHLQICPQCRQELQQMDDFLTELAPTIELSPLEKIAGHMRQLVARLKPQLPIMPVTGLRPALAGVRGTAPKQLAYTAEEIQIMLDVTPDGQQPAQQQILGLILGISNLANLHMQLRMVPPGDQPNAAPTALASEGVSELGNFVFTGVAPGCYELLLTGPSLSVRIPDIQV